MIGPRLSLMKSSNKKNEFCHFFGGRLPEEIVKVARERLQNREAIGITMRVFSLSIYQFSVFVSIQHEGRCYMVLELSFEPTSD